MNLFRYMKTKYEERKDKDNIYGVGISDEEFRKFIIQYLLGEDWYISDPIGRTQINEIALYEILNKYSKRYKKEKRYWINKKRRIDIYGNKESQMDS